MRTATPCPEPTLRKRSVYQCTGVMGITGVYRLTRAVPSGQWPVCSHTSHTGGGRQRWPKAQMIPVSSGPLRANPQTHRRCPSGPEARVPDAQAHTYHVSARPGRGLQCEPCCGGNVLPASPSPPAAAVSLQVPAEGCVCRVLLFQPRLNQPTSQTGSSRLHSVFKASLGCMRPRLKNQPRKQVPGSPESSFFSFCFQFSCTPPLSKHWHTGETC